MKNLIFDLDGTLGDSLPICLEAFKKTVEPYTGKQLTDKEIEKHFGISEEGIINNLLPDNFNKAMQDYVECYSRLLDNQPKPFTGTIELLKFLHNYSGVNVFMVTGKGKTSADITLEKYRLSPYFKDILYGSPTGGIKEKCIDKLIIKYDLKRSETVYIGDAISDITAAKNCNIKIIAAGWASTANTKMLQKNNPDYLFTSFNEFSDFLFTHHSH